MRFVILESRTRPAEGELGFVNGTLGNMSDAGIAKPYWDVFIGASAPFAVPNSFEKIPISASLPAGRSNTARPRQPLFLNSSIVPAWLANVRAAAPRSISRSRASAKRRQAFIF